MPHFAGNQQQLIHRISGIEGHVRSLKKLIAEDREPLEILMQISSIRAAMERLSHLIFEEFVEGSLHDIQFRRGAHHGHRRHPRRAGDAARNRADPLGQRRGPDDHDGWATSDAGGGGDRR